MGGRQRTTIFMGLEEKKSSEETEKSKAETKSGKEKKEKKK